MIRQTGKTEKLEYIVKIPRTINLGEYEEVDYALQKAFGSTRRVGTEQSGWETSMSVTVDTNGLGKSTEEISALIVLTFLSALNLEVTAAQVNG